MFEVGFWEIIVVLLVALTVLGPKRLPAAARILGRYLSAMRTRYVRFKQEFQNELSNFTDDQKP